MKQHYNSNGLKSYKKIFDQILLKIRIEKKPMELNIHGLGTNNLAKTSYLTRNNEEYYCYVLLLIRLCN
jgi:hypothetical protein